MFQQKESKSKCQSKSKPEMLNSRYFDFD